MLFVIFDNLTSITKIGLTIYYYFVCIVKVLKAKVKEVKNAEKMTSVKYCFVPLCRSSSKIHSEQIFIHLPQGDDIRKKWYAAVNSNGPVSRNTRIYCCEDHFDVSQC